jgi:hypothetical protein
VHAGAEACVAAVFRDEDPDVVPLGGPGDERRLHVHDRCVSDERAWIDHAAGAHLQRRDGDVVGRAVVVATGQVAFAGLRARRSDEPAQHSHCERDAHGRRP